MHCSLVIFVDEFHTAGNFIVSMFDVVSLTFVIQLKIGSQQFNRSDSVSSVK